MNRQVLDEYEQEIADAYQAGTLKPSKNQKQLLERSKLAARRYFEKKARLNIRVTESDLSKLKRQAALDGLPYQTLAASILHKYFNGTL